MFSLELHQTSLRRALLGVQVLEGHSLCYPYMILVSRCTLGGFVLGSLALWKQAVSRSISHTVIGSGRNNIVVAVTVAVAHAIV